MIDIINFLNSLTVVPSVAIKLNLKKNYALSINLMLA